MRRRHKILLLAGMLAVAVPGAALSAASSGRTDRTITQRAIAGAPLGWSQRQYVRALGRPFLLGRLEGGITRLDFTRRGVEVYLRRGAGFAVNTHDPRYRTTAGVGPCSSARALTAAYGGRLRKLPGPGPIAIYWLGNLLFRVDRPHARVGAVTLGTGPIARTVAGNSQDCRSRALAAAAHVLPVRAARSAVARALPKQFPLRQEFWAWRVQRCTRKSAHNVICGYHMFVADGRECWGTAEAVYTSASSRRITIRWRGTTCQL